MTTIPTPKLATEYLNLKSRALRDLAWSFSCSSLFVAVPSLPHEWFKDDYIVKAQLLQWLRSVDESPALLNKHLSQQRSTRLGIYFEQLLSFYFNYYEYSSKKRFTLLAKNHQVIEKKRTLGEFDFIVLDNINGDIKHIEVAVKFYLGHPNYNQAGIHPIEKNQPLHNWHNWIGPNFRDTLAIKMRHLQMHQLPLSQSVVGQDSLGQLLQRNNTDISTNSIKPADVGCRLHLSGRFFSPLFESMPAPDYAQYPIANFWLYLSEFINAITVNESGHSRWQEKLQERYKTAEVHYCLLPKQYWLSEITAQDIIDAQLLLLDEASLWTFLQRDDQENQWHLAIIDTQLFAQQSSNSSALHIEHGRFFIIKKE